MTQREFLSFNRLRSELQKFSNRLLKQQMIYVAGVININFGERKEK